MPPVSLVVTTAAMCLVGAFGGALAALLGLPLPWLLGSIAAVALIAILAPRRLPEGYAFPQGLRILFIALIGMLIGAQVTPDLIRSVPHMALSMAGVVVFVLLAQAANYMIFRRLGRFDAPTAWFAGAPGGLVESITMGEAAGAEIPVLVTQQFLRIILVIGLVPLALSVWHGTAMGSASGLDFGPERAALGGLPLVLAVAIIGALIGRALHLPAWQLTGALLASAVLSLLGHPLAPPGWLVDVAMVVVGAGLGLRFTGFNRRLLLRGLWLSAASVSAMLMLGAGLAALVQRATGQDFEMLLIAYAPGGINEMALIALWLEASPATVTLHHILRLVVTILGMGVVARRLARRGTTTL